MGLFNAFFPGLSRAGAKRMAALNTAFFWPDVLCFFPRLLVMVNLQVATT